MNIPSKYEIILSICRLASLESDMSEDHKFELRNIALDIAGVARDNTVETGCCEIFNESGKWPYWGMCRDQILEGIEEAANNPERMAAMILSFDKVAALDVVNIMAALEKLTKQGAP